MYPTSRSNSLVFTTCSQNLSFNIFARRLPLLKFFFRPTTNHKSKICCLLNSQKTNFPISKYTNFNDNSLNLKFLFAVLKKLTFKQGSTNDLFYTFASFLFALISFRYTISLFLNIFSQSPLPLPILLLIPVSSSDLYCAHQILYKMLGMKST